MLCDALICFAMLCFAMRCFALLCFTLFCFAMPKTTKMMCNADGDGADENDADEMTKLMPMVMMIMFSLRTAEGKYVLVAALCG